MKSRLKTNLFLSSLLLGLLFCGRVEATRKLAVLVAANEGIGNDEKLLFAEKDAEKMRNVLIELSGVAPEDALLIAGAKPKQVRSALEKIAQRIKLSENEETVLFFYYSGHADSTALKMHGERLPLSDLKTKLSATTATLQIVVLDSCKSGAITRIKGGRRVPAFQVKIDDEKIAAGQVIIASSSANEVSQESDELSGSYFTHYLVSGLRGDADRTRDDKISLQEAYDYAYHFTVVHTAQSRQGSQHPTYRFDIRGVGDFVWTDLARRQSTLRFPRGVSDEFLIWDRANRTVVAEVRLNGTGGGIALPPGEYTIKRRLDDHIRLANVTLRENDVREIDLTAMKRVEFEDDFTKGSLKAPLELMLGAKGGYQRFLDAKTRADLLAPVAAVGIQLALLKIPADFLDLKLEIYVAHGDQNFVLRKDVVVNGGYTQLDVALALPAVWRKRYASLYAGPRVSMMVLWRRFDETAHKQNYISFSPGVVGGVGFFPLKNLGFEFEARLNYLYVQIDDQSRNLAFLELFGGIAWKLDI